eukprot:3224677-Rhodomonas_salina.1
MALLHAGVSCSERINAPKLDQFVPSCEPSSYHHSSLYLPFNGFVISLPCALPPQADSSVLAGIGEGRLGRSVRGIRLRAATSASTAHAHSKSERMKPTPSTRTPRHHGVPMPAHCKVHPLLRAMMMTPDAPHQSKRHMQH